MSEEGIEFPNQEITSKQTVETYLMDLGLDWDKLKDKKVLDLGAGLGKFAEAAKKRGVDVVSLDAHPEWHSNKGSLPNDIPFVVGDGQQLPFKDEVFDVIVARAAVDSMIEVKEDLEAVLSEAKRVLKTGGEFRFGPGGIGVRPVREEEWDKWFELLDKVRNKQEITSEENAWGAKVWPEYERELHQNDDLEGLTREETIKKMDEFSLALLHSIDPTITAHPYIRTMYWKGELEHEPNVYYVMRKPILSPQS